VETVGVTALHKSIVSMLCFHHNIMRITLKQYSRGVRMAAIIIGEETRDLGVVEVKALEDMVVNLNKANTE
jgi:hypothetical protein